MTQFRKWPSINKFSDIYKAATRFEVSSLTYNAKIKLHGTNAAIRVLEDGTLQAQSRTGDIFVGKDNAGFAQFVSTITPCDAIADFHKTGAVVYGEWAGKGVQSGDAIAQTEKAFYVFGIVMNDGTALYQPANIQIMIDTMFGENDRIHVLPWFYNESITVNVLDQKDAQAFIDKATADVDAIGEEDPYVKAKYGISGPGEGLVFYCQDIQGPEIPDHMRLEVFDSYRFKHKTEAHSVNKSKNRNHVAPEKPEGIDDFIQMFLTEARCRQMIFDHSIDIDRKNTGVFIKAVMSDIHKESVNELELADFDWKTVTKYLATEVRRWWLAECDKL